MFANWSSIELLYGFVVWGILVYIVANAVRVVGLVPDSMSFVLLVSLLSLGSLLLVAAIGTVWYFRDDSDSAASGDVF